MVAGKNDYRGELTRYVHNIVTHARPGLARTLTDLVMLYGL